VLAALRLHSHYNEREADMLIVRPVRISDLPHVEHMAVESGIGVTSLPNNREKLYEKIQNSLGAFEHEAIAGTGREYYMFVLEDEGRVVGTASISASAGFEEPFYSYRSETMVHASRALKVNNRIHVLTMCHDLTGLVQLCGFYCDPQYTMRAYELLSRARLLYMAAARERFGRRILVEMQGMLDADNQSPFWDAIGRNFFDLNYAAAERLCGLKSRTFLAELMPHYPIYVPLLPDSAQEAMGQVHPRAQITFDILMREGFETDHYIDIFDGGPTLHARVSGIRSIAQSRVVPVKIGEMVKGAGRQYLVSNAQLQDYRAVMLELDYAPGNPVTLDLAAAEALGVGEGASVRLVAV